MPNVYAIVPAAGESRRMGTQKLLLPFAGTTVIGHVVRTLLAAPVRGAVVVVSPANTGVADEARRAGADTVTNAAPHADMLSSVRCGLRALPAECDAALVALGDQPTIRPNLIADLVLALHDHDGRIVVPVCGGIRGHPLVIAAKWFDEALLRHDGVGLRGLLSAHPDSVVEVPTRDPEVLRDVDDPEAYRRAVLAHENAARARPG
jgi:molybdenum cofactor cytidylyltransferase